MSGSQQRGAGGTAVAAQNRNSNSAAAATNNNNNTSPKTSAGKSKYSNFLKLSLPGKSFDTVQAKHLKKLFSNLLRHLLTVLIFVSFRSETVSDSFSKIVWLPMS
jgi:hypothetical protein